MLTAAMTLLALPTGFIGPVMVFGGLLFFGVIGFHYFVWGRWLTEIVRQEVEEQDASGREDQGRQGSHDRDGNKP